MRVARLRTFRTRITEWGKPSLELFEEPVIVTIKKKRKRTVDEREVEWWDEFTKDHLHVDVVRFRDLLDHKKATGYTLGVSDGVLAYMTIFGYGEKSVISGFLWAMSDIYPEFRSRAELIKIVEVYKGLKPEERISVVKGTLKEIEDSGKLTEAVGQALSRFAREEAIEKLKGG